MKFAVLLFVAGTLVAASPTNFTIASRQDPADLMIFVCDQMPEVCHNMCYGALCLNIGSALTFDNPSATDKRNRRKAAGCIESGGNRCSVRKGHAAGFQCDEYPFASSSPRGTITDRINRCVPAGENSKQGGIINAFYRASFCKGGPCDFNVEFSNAGNIAPCQMDCTDSDNEIIGPGSGTPAQDGDEADDGTDDDGGNPEPTGTSKKKRVVTGARHHYLTSSGVEIDIRGIARIGQRAVTVVARNTTLWDEQAKSHAYDDENDESQYDYMLPNLEVRDDVIIAELS
ncbi:hypothetical protein EXIGLDRAFT_709762 [Exidia glandulosa HHB12029]|uniref:Deoxyribonuclease NucA/NucB domain-containing protein n=1 Tax=Exidia glandulosa HHB12029 TaxID=1314781 RepID=A0A165ISJ7_EXIGL|nr:hypothetical protein EXIGLDRAFT_709762 [Exidia glandulosa HHB12029]